jgi:hypothetical protein
MTRIAKKMTAWLAMVSLTTLGAQPLVAASHSGHATRLSPSAADRTVAELFDREGGLRLRVRGRNFDPARTLSAVQQLRADPEVVDKWRAAIEHYATRVENSEERLARVRRLIAALEAETPAEFHARVMELGVSVSRTAARNASGVDGIQTAFIVNGAVRLKIFTAAPVPMDNEAGTSPIPLSAGGSTVPELTAYERTLDECYYEGEPDDCATQQEIDDALAYALAAEDEMYELEDDVDEACQQNPGQCEADADFLVPGIDEVPDGSTDTSGAFYNSAPCEEEVQSFALAAGGTQAAIFGLVAVAFAPVSALVLTGAVVAVGTGLAAMWWTAEDAIECAEAI